MYRLKPIGRRVLLGCAAAAVGLALVPSVAPSIAVADAYPSEPIRLIIPFNPGGSNDRFARALGPHLSKALNTPVVVENKPGAGTLLGHQYFLQQQDDGYAFLVSAPHPYMSNNILTQNASFKLDEFTWVNLPWEDTSLIVTAKDKPYKTLDDLVKAIKAEPGKVSIGVVANSSDHINAVAMLDALGIDKNAVKWITYAGGGPLRTAIAGGHVDVGSSTADGTLKVIDLVRPLVVFGDERLEEWNAPTIYEALDGKGAKKRDYLAGSIRGIGVRTSFKEKHPDRWKKIVEAIETVSADQANQKEFREKGMRLKWSGPEKAETLVRKNYDVLVDSVKLLEN